MLFADWCDTVFKNLRCDRLRWHLDGIHSIYYSLEAFVGEWRLIATEFYNPMKEKNVLKGSPCRVAEPQGKWSQSALKLVHYYETFSLITLYSHSLVQIVEGV